MDRLLRRELDAIARDRTSGAAELALRAVKALQTWLRRHSKPSEQELLEIARALLTAQPSMAPLLRLANEVALAVDSAKPARRLAETTAGFGRLLRTAPQRIARLFGRALGPGRTQLLATYSCSSTVVRALQFARRRIAVVLCSESRPGNEGRATASQLVAAGTPVIFSTDLALASRMDQVSAFATGADAILPHGFVNKAGTDVLIACARKAHTPVWVLADTTKFVPQSMAARLSIARAGKESEIWRQAPAGVRIINPLFEPAPFFSAIRVLTERGWMGPKDVREELRKIRVSSRLRGLG